MATIRQRLRKRANWNIAIPWGIAIFFVATLAYAPRVRIPRIIALVWVALMVAAELGAMRLLALRMRCPKCSGKLKNQDYKLVNCPHCGVNFDYPMPQ